jgi:hypothetical protein
MSHAARFMADHRYALCFDPALWEMAPGSTWPAAEPGLYRVWVRDEPLRA